MIMEKFASRKLWTAVLAAFAAGVSIYWPEHQIAINKIIIVLLSYMGTQGLVDASEKFGLPGGSKQP